MAKYIYNWIQDKGHHLFIRRYKEHHYREQKFRYVMIEVLVLNLHWG